MKRIIFTLFFVISLLFLSSAYSQEISKDLSFAFDIGTSSVTGNNTYDFNYDEINSVLGEINSRSILEWDIDNYMLDLGMQAGYMNQYFFQFEYSTSVSEGTVSMRDRDWLKNDIINYFYVPLMSDTTSDVESNANIYDLRFMWRIPRLMNFDNLRVRLSVGYLKQKWDGYKAMNVVGFQRGLLTSDGSLVNFDLTSETPYVTYEVEHKIPYFGIGFDFDPNEKLNVSLGVDLSSMAQTKDKDDHAARGKITETDAEGSFISFKGEASWNFYKNMMLALTFESITIKTEGEQTQTWYKNEGLTPAGTVLTVKNNEISSDQTYVGLKFRCLF
ncbi:MAG: omptin family outer membrane protease [Candidatus Aureabacteria bacterium]|nr:omptin family outer membrane protease [Candidatus Auribacterota bacterium]